MTWWMWMAAGYAIGVVAGVVIALIPRPWEEEGR
jgi:hypothetical protein